MLQLKWKLMTATLMASVVSATPVNLEVVGGRTNDLARNPFLDVKAAQSTSNPRKRSALAKVYTTCKTPNTVALTFDDGPYKYEQQISNILTSAGIKATFFVNGNNYDCIYDPQQVTSLTHTYNAGHQIAAHTWSHPDLTTLSSSQINTEMQRIETALKKILGVVPAMMRPPYGSYNEQVRQVAAQRNQSLIIWDFDSGDSTGSTAQQSETAYDQLVQKHPNTILALNHETYETTANDVLPHAISDLQAKGYKFATVADCLGINPYQTVGKPGKRDSSWTC